MKTLIIALLFLGLEAEVSWATSRPLPQVAPAAGLLANSAETNPPANVNGTGGTDSSLEAKLAEARAQLAAFGDTGLTNAAPGVSAEDIWMRRAGLHRLVRLYEQQLSNAVALERARTRTAEIAREGHAWRGFAESPPYSILLTDRLREEIQAERQKIKSAEAAASLLTQLIEESRDSLTEAEGKLRQLNEQLESPNDPALAARLSWQREQARLLSRLSIVTLAVLDLERLIGQEGLAGSRAHLDLLQKQLVVADADTKFTRADLDRLISQIERQSEQLEAELATMQSRWLSAVQALANARDDLRQMRSGTNDQLSSTRAMELVLTRETQLDTANTAIYVLRLMAEGASIEGVAWQSRFAAAESRSANVLSESERRLANFTRRLNLWRNYTRQQLEWCSRQLEIADSRLNSLQPESDLLLLARERLNALRERELFLLRFVGGVERLDSLGRRWAEALRDAESELPITGRVRNLFSNAGSFLQRLWNFEVFTAEDTIMVEGQKITGKRSVTVRKVVMALLILVAGYWLSGRLSALLERLLVKKLKIELNQANLMRRWLRSLLVVCLIVFSLVSVKIPLTVFAFAGGALAIALGFGMQTVLKNFVSGLILLFERPFRVGDVLDVGGQKGTITSVGLRASVLQLWDGTETLIPNSFLLENNVTNWTYSSPKVRFAVTVGVAYGSDLRRVTQLLKEAMERHGLVEKEPEPQVLFTEFGDSALSFELRFWVNVAKANAAQIASDLRLMIAGIFAEHAIQIAFPQRDLHLHADRPIPMQVVPAAEGREVALCVRGKPELGGQSHELP